MSKGTSLQRLLEHSVAKYPDKVGLRYGSRGICFHELDLLSRQLAGGLLKEGIQSGDRVALFVPNCPEAVTAYFACYMIGAVAVPLNYRYSSEEALSIIHRIQAKILIFHQERQQIVDSFREKIPHCSTFIIGPSHSSSSYQSISGLYSSRPLGQLHAAPPDHPALILFTSGSTGDPKGVVHSHHSAFAAIDISRKIFYFTSEDIVLVGKPISHAGGLQTQLMPTLFMGGEVVLVSKPSPAEAVAIIQKQSITQYAMLASDLLDFIEYMEAHPIALPTLQNCLGSGDSVPTDLHQRFKTIFGWEVMEGCGLTEVNTYYTVNPRMGKRKWGSLGLACPETTLCIMDEARQVLPTGKVGEIAIRTPSATIGYLDDPTGTQSLFHDGWLLTGDLGYVDEEEYVWFVGRKKLIIVRRGSNISPIEVENLIDEHPDVHASVVVGVPDKQDGQVPIAWVVPISSTQPLSEHDLRKYLEPRLAEYKTPVRFFFLQALPLTSTGKYDRHHLEELGVATLKDKGTQQN